ncbi:MAG: hypothetical protein ABJE47_09835 [bacterium]
MDQAALMMTLRVIHIVAGVLWVGAVALLAFFISPAIAASGPAGGRIMQEITRRKIGPYMGAMPGLVLLSGLAMYGYQSAITHGAFSHSHFGMTLGIGGAVALVAGIIGGAVTGRTAQALEKLGTSMQAAGAAPGAEQQQELKRLQDRLVSSARVVSVLTLIATALMAIARYT